jgi:hypothetical protein
MLSNTAVTGGGDVRMCGLGGCADMQIGGCVVEFRQISHSTEISAPGLRARVAHLFFPTRILAPDVMLCADMRMCRCADWWMRC